MSDNEAALVAMAAVALLIAVLAMLAWAVSAARRRSRRPPEGDVVVDLTFLHDAVRRTEQDGRELTRHGADDVSGRRSTWPEGGGR